MTKSNKIQHTKKALLEALEKSLGIVTAACKTVSIDRTTFYRYVNEDSKFAQSVKDIENLCFDYVETQLYGLIKDGNPAAIIFYAKTKMKNRGYVERQEITGKDGKDLPITGFNYIHPNDTNSKTNGQATPRIHSPAK